MFPRWFFGAFMVTVLTTLALLPWSGDSRVPQVMVGFFVILFAWIALKYLLLTGVFAWGLQFLLQKVMPPGWKRTALLAFLTALGCGIGSYLEAGLLRYLALAPVAAAVGAVLADSDLAWRYRWPVLLGATALAAPLSLAVSAAMYH